VRVGATGAAGIVPLAPGRALTPIPPVAPTYGRMLATISSRMAELAMVEKYQARALFRLDDHQLLAALAHAVARRRTPWGHIDGRDDVLIDHHTRTIDDDVAQQGLGAHSEQGQPRTAGDLQDPVLAHGNLHDRKLDPMLERCGAQPKDRWEATLPPIGVELRFAFERTSALVVATVIENEQVVVHTAIELDPGRRAPRMRRWRQAPNACRGVSCPYLGHAADPEPLGRMFDRVGERCHHLVECHEASRRAASRVAGNISNSA
jgi:hypothetical protein